jgi:outer membrane lipoprotein-sorting protein
MIRHSISRLFALAFFTLAIGASLSAQDASSLLNALSEKAKGYGSVQATYQSTLIDKVNDFEMVQSGSILIDGDRYRLDLGDYLVISDGTTIWTYEKAINDCYIDDVADVAEEGMDPSELFTIWEDDFTHESRGTATANGLTCQVVYLFPQAGTDKPFHTIVLYIDAEALEMVRAEVKGREGTDVIYDVLEFNPGGALPSDSFEFSNDHFPGVNLIDNRI